MNNIHEQLKKEYSWYQAWHNIPYISVLHFIILAGVGYGVASATAEQISVVESQIAASAQAASVISDGAGVGNFDYSNHAGTDFGPWFTISHWKNCPNLMQQGKTFELQNSEGQSMWSECTPQVPLKPFGWYSEPVRFRLVKDPQPLNNSTDQ
jgi:hypothetical protein